MGVNHINRDDVLHKAKTGLRGAQIAALYGVSNSVIRRLLRECGWEPHMRRPMGLIEVKRIEIRHNMRRAPDPIKKPAIKLPPHPIKYESIVNEPVHYGEKSYNQIRKEGIERRKPQHDALMAQLRADKEARDKARGGPLVDMSKDGQAKIRYHRRRLNKKTPAARC